MHLRSLAVAVVLAVLVPRTSVADAEDDRHALVMLRALAYDKQLAQRVTGEVRIVVVAPPDADGDAELARWLAAFAKARKLKVDGRTVTVVGHRFESRDALDRALDKPYAALIACAGLTRRLAAPQLAAITRAHKVLSMSMQETDVVHGLGFGIVAGRTRNELVINDRGVTAEGVRFDAGLLQLARRVKEQP